MNTFYKSLLAVATAVILPPFISNGYAQDQVQTFSKSVASGADDVEEAASGSMLTNSTTLQLVYDNTRTKNQIIGLRFTGISIPANALISNAYIQFTAAEALKKGCTLSIKGQASDNAPSFSTATANVSSRSRTSSTVSWALANWNILNEAGAAQATPNLKDVVQEIISRPGWASGNAMAFIISGTGKRTAYAYEGSASGAPQLVIEYTLPVVEPEPPVVPVGPFPVKKSSVWKYHDKGVDLGTAWTATTYDDASWAAGAAVLGYGDPVTTTLSFGSSSTSKHLTYYLRHKFNVEDASVYDTLVFNIRRDDGAVIYLNGVEQFRTNMPAGAITYNSVASTAIGSTDETTYYTFKVPSAKLMNGHNVVAVSLHQANASSSDLLFDMEVVGKLKSTTPPAPEPVPSNKIGSFTSVTPSAQQQIFVFPSTHTFQLIAKSGATAYTSGGTMPGGNDFTAYVPQNGSSAAGFLSINHENNPGGVSLLNLTLNEQSKLWAVNGAHKVDFTSIVKTERNCSGGITPWGTVITSEESYVQADVNGDGYFDTGWQVEIDPVTKKVRDYDGDGKPDKLWALGRMQHENVAVGKDSITVYQGEDGGSSCLYKFVANKAGNLTAGTLYVLKRTTTSSTTGEWVVVPNTTQSDRNNTSSIALGLGGTNWSNIEDVEFGPDGRMYFTSKGTGTIWRFKDNGTTVSEIEAWVKNQSYTITHAIGTSSVPFGTGIDNLVFDGDGNLWALQDGGSNYIWVIRPDHTATSPKVELFATVPLGAESTGLTFTPDFKYGFISFQHPATTNSQSQTDAAGSQVVYNAPTTIVFARKEYLGQTTAGVAGSASVSFVQQESKQPEQMQVKVFPNPFQKSTQIQISIIEKAPVLVEVLSLAGIKVQTLVNSTLDAGSHTYTLDAKGLTDGMYLLRVTSNNQVTTQKIIHSGK